MITDPIVWRNTVVIKSTRFAAIFVSHSCCWYITFQRIAELIKRKNKQRLAKQAVLAKKEAAGDFSHLKNKKGEIVGNILPQPTLPNVSLDDDHTIDMRMRQGQYATSSPAPDWKPDYQSVVDHGSNGQPDYPEYPPPMPEYQPYSHVQPQGSYAAYGQSVGTLPQDEMYDKYDAESEYGSHVHLPYGAAPFAQAQHVDASANGLSDPYPNTVAAYSQYARHEPQDSQHDRRY